MKKWAILTALTALGASLLYGDGIITLSPYSRQLKDWDMATDASAHYVVPITCLILLALFSIQRFGTSIISRWGTPR